MASEDAGPRLPTELVHDIVSSVVACYIDDLIMGPLSLFANRNVAEDLEEVPTYFSVCVSLRVNSEQQDLVLASPSPVLALLAVSNQLRQVTLEILSDALAIPLRNDAVCVEFWRYVYMSSLLAESKLSTLSGRHADWSVNRGRYFAQSARPP